LPNKLTKEKKAAERRDGMQATLLLEAASCSYRSRLIGRWVGIDRLAAVLSADSSKILGIPFQGTTRTSNAVSKDSLMGFALTKVRIAQKKTTALYKNPFCVTKLSNGECA